MKSVIKYNVLTYASPEDVVEKDGKLVYILPESVKEIDVNAFIDFRETKNIFTNKTTFPIVLDSIVLNNNIKVIKDKTFSQVQTKTIVLSKKLRYIGNYAFSASLIENIVLPDNVDNLGDGAFSYCKNLKNIYLSSSLKRLRSNTFKGCKNLKELMLPKSLNYIGESCFMQSGIIKIFIPETLSTIEDFAFLGCYNLKEIKLPENLQKLNNSVFQDCWSLDNIIIPKNVTSIGSNCFCNCKSLESIKMHDEIKGYNFACFYGCINLKEITLENNNIFKVLIDDQSFTNCTKLEKVILKGNFDFYPTIFETCSSLKSLTIFNKEYDFSSLNNIRLYIESKNELNKLQLISSSIKNYGMIEYQFAKELCYYNLHEQFSNAYFKFYKRLKSKFFTKSSDCFDVASFEKLCFNLGIFENDRDTANKSYNFLDDILSQKFIETNNMYYHFQDMLPYGYKKEFTNFFINKENFKKLMAIENQGMNIISQIYNRFEELQENNLSHNTHHYRLAPTVEKFKEMLTSNNFKGVNETNVHIAEEIGKFSKRQSHFDDALFITHELEKMEKQKGYKDYVLKENPFETIEFLENEIIKTNLESLQNLGKAIDKNFSYEWLSKHDPKNFMLGYYCSSCAHLGGNGDGIMRASIILPNVKNLVIKNKNDRIIAKATLYINEIYGYGVFNSIQLSDFVKLESEKEKVYEKFLKGAYAFIDEYNKTHKKPITKVNVGMNLNAFYNYLLRDFVETDILTAIDYSNYGIDHFYPGDWQMKQCCIYNKEINIDDKDFTEE